MQLTHGDWKIWSVILAGGAGRRMKPLIQQWLGSCRPKQYCTFVGTRSMFQHTIDRSDLLVPPERRVSVVARSHLSIVFQQLNGRRPGVILLQPEDRDTAPGIFIALSYIRAQDPRAVAVVFPTDHFIFPESRFIETVADAVQASLNWPDRIILLGATPDSPDPDYGWIQPGTELGSCKRQPVCSVRGFEEKPGALRALHAMESGMLWNTFVLVSRVETFWELGRSCLPAMMDLFEKLQDAIGTGRESRVIDMIYREMPSSNFSADLLTRVTDRVAVVELHGIFWSDWGRPERIAGSLEALGRQPAFPMEYLRAS